MSQSLTSTVAVQNPSQPMVAWVPPSSPTPTSSAPPSLPSANPCPLKQPSPPKSTTSPPKKTPLPSLNASLTLASVPSLSTVGLETCEIESAMIEWLKEVVNLINMKMGKDIAVLENGKCQGTEDAICV
ncbi:hypothetical protein GYMLUDRAFT_1028676 [Collybiopsis luxurians FD-317 M1]|uniref:Uncharacterized protein n=1 Tax=Collybiopsis luxurians FD-317 M1 TaxID=944289 RepID=A0A0D0BDH8_9AGAR|nr:hypothetical protein GYMLUDRAFT_1028676 [Collybiopsis luxurians FD-317 M1]